MTVRQSGTMRSTDRDWRADPAFCADAISKAPTGFVPFTIRAEEFQEEGASAVEEVGYALAAGVDFLAEMQQRGVSIDRAADSIIFSFAMGPEYFMQIAKLRAFRMAWAQVVRTFGGSRDHAKAQIYARSAQWDRTIYDPQVNILRATTEAMSAVLGGADSVCVAPFDGCYRHANESSRRLARNTQIILKQEAELARVADPGGGSYYLEALTDSIARKAWKLLQDVEASGVDGKAADSIAQTLAVRKTAQDKAVVNRHRVLTGTNRFADPKERALDRIDYPFTNDTSRAAAPFEELRLRTESWIAKSGQGPRIVLAEIGDPKMRAARSNFVADFLACAGLVTEIKQFGAAAQIGEAEADLIVVCSSDPEYVAIATEMLAEMRSRGSEVPVLIAGNPESSEQLRAAGITDFIHLRSNPIELLTRLQKILGIGK
jgi:methylmalonyl-CoA mutase